MRLPIPALLLFVGCVGVLRADARPVAIAPALTLTATPIPLDMDAPGRRRVGALVYQAGWVLRGSDPAFGGISAMTITGDRFTLLSDEGRLATFRMRADGVVRGARLRPVPGIGGFRDPRRRDAEAMTRDSATGTVWIGLEQVNAIVRIDPTLSRALAARRPPAMRRWALNGSVETLVRLRDGRVVAIAEEGTVLPGTRTGLLFAGDPTRPGPPPIRFAYRPPAGTSPTDAAETEDGRIVVLNRHFSMGDGFAAAVSIFPTSAIRPSAVIVPRVLARLRRPLATDNMEAIAVTREGGATMIWIASDDNMTLLQRTLLLKFRLAE